MKDEASDAPLTYAASGVDYDLMDPFKRMAQQAARATAGNLAHFGFQEVAASRGESAYLIETPDAYLAHVEEGLGTKNLVADAMYRLTGRTFYDHIGQDTVAMIVNDLITVGAMPVSIAMHLAVGTSEWFADTQRVADLVRGFQHACNLSRAVWGGGETPTLRKIVAPDTAVLAGSAMGIIRPKERLIRANLAEGDVILFLAASGIHANGLTLAQRIAERLPQGYLTPLPDGRPYGEALLDPTPIYVPVLDDLLSAGIVPHYTANVTGHGWRKLMRASEPFVYVIDRIPEPPPIFPFMQEHGPITDEEAYGNLNMGAGFALYLAPEHVEQAQAIAESHGIGTLVAGTVEKRGDDKRVVIRPKGIEYAGETLGVR
jgi:phosphoribosylformylglycinamidine cyclo-ligase